MTYLDNYKERAKILISPDNSYFSCLKNFIMPYLKSVLFTSLLFLGLSCSKNQEEYQKHVVINITQGGYGYLDGASTLAKFNSPLDVAVDPSGNIYVTDNKNFRIRKITPTGDVSTFAGSGNNAWSDGIGTAASFYQPFSIAADIQGNLYVTDGHLRKISSSGVVTTIGSTYVNYGEPYLDGPLATATFGGIQCVATDNQGNIYFYDAWNYSVRKISLDGMVSTLAGSGKAGYINGTGKEASFNTVFGLAVDGSGNVYVANNGNVRVRKITPQGKVTTLAGDGKRNDQEGNGEQASFVSVSDVTVDGEGNVFVADEAISKIKKITPTGDVSVYAGSGYSGYAAGQYAIEAKFAFPNGVGIDKYGAIYVADTENNMIRQIK